MKFELQALTIGITSILKILQGTQSLIEEFHSFSGQKNKTEIMFQKFIFTSRKLLKWETLATICNSANDTKSWTFSDAFNLNLLSCVTFENRPLLRSFLLVKA